MSDRPTRKFCCSYTHDGATWSLLIDAYDWPDAHARIAKLGYLRLDGELEMVVRSGFFARAYCAVRNAFPPNAELRHGEKETHE